MTKIFSFLKRTVPVLGVLAVLIACMNPVDFDPDSALATINITGNINTRDVTEAVLLFTNLSKTVDVTKVTITREAEKGEDPSSQPGISFENKPKRLTKKA